jgi:hypothetical protein
MMTPLASVGVDRVVAGDIAHERVVITIHATSTLANYLEGLTGETDRINESDDRETDLVIIAPRDRPVDQRDGARPGGIANFGPDRGVARFEVLRAPHVVEDTRHVKMSVPSDDGTLAEDLSRS